MVRCDLSTVNGWRSRSIQSVCTVTIPDRSCWLPDCGNIWNRWATACSHTTKVDIQLRCPALLQTSSSHNADQVGAKKMGARHVPIDRHELMTSSASLLCGTHQRRIGAGGILHLWQAHCGYGKFEAIDHFAFRLICILRWRSSLRIRVLG